MNFVVPGVSLLDTSTKELVADFSLPDLPGATFRLAHVTRADGLTKITERCTRIEWDREKKTQVEVVDQDVFAAECAKAIFRGWDGLTVGKLASLLPLDVAEGVDLTTPVPFDLGTAATILRHALTFAKWAVSTAADPANFAGVRAVPRNAQSAT